jgi:hypothetical protein
MMTPVRAPFIWTPRQPIAENWLLALRDLPARDDGKNRWFLFRAEMDIAAVPADAPTSITVDGRYILFVNGRTVGRGPVRCSPLFQRFDTYDLAPYLTEGRNVVAVLVHTYGVDTAFHEEVRGLWRPVFGDGGLWVDGPVVHTRQPWRCTQTDAWVQDVPQSNHSLGFIEWFDANALPEGWTGLDFDDAGWDDAQPMVVGGEGPESMYQGTRVRPFPILRPSEIPPLVETFVPARSIRWVKGQQSQPELTIETRLYDEPLVPVPPEAAHDVEALLHGGDAATLIRTADGIDTAFTLDFGRILSGYPAFEIDAAGGEIIEIACCERLPGEWQGEVSPDARIERRPNLGTDAHLCRYVAKPGWQRFQRFEWCAIRYMHIVVRNAPSGVTIRRLGATETHYAAEACGSFSCSDPMLTQLWSTGAYTLRQCMHDAWEDCPSREQRQWSGDATVENAAGWAAYGKSIAQLTAKYLRQAAESQRPDGLTQMFAPGDHKHNARLIPDWTLQWILCGADHWDLTGDVTTMEAIFPSIQKVLGWFEEVAGSRGLVADMPYWHFMDWAGLGRDGQALALNAQLAGAYRGAAKIARAIGYDVCAEKYDRRADDITKRLDHEHWDERRGVWVDMVDPVTGEQQPRVSQHGVAGLALWGNPDPARVARAFARITDPARVTQTPAPPVVPYGTPLDEEEGVVMANTFYAHFVGEALARHGWRATALANIRQRFSGMIEAGSSTLWEATTPWASLCHGFSASPTWFLSRHVLGVAAQTPGFGRITITPDLLGLDDAEGIVPIGDHQVHVALRRTPGGFEAVVTGAIEAVEMKAAAGLELIEHHRDGETLRAEFKLAETTDGN